MQLQMRHTLCWNIPYVIPLEISFHHYLKNVVLGSLKYVFQLDQQVDITLYLTKAIALHHSRESAGLEPPWYIVSPIGLLGFKDFKINLFSLESERCDII